MKKLIVFALLLTGCLQPNKKQFDAIFKGNHELRRLSQQEKTLPSQASASYFLFWGSASGKGEETKSYIVFSWKSINNQFILSKYPINNVRIQFDENCKSPYVSFGYADGLSNYSDSDFINPDLNTTDILDRYIDYVVIHCKQYDYSPDIKVNSLD